MARLRGVTIGAGYFARFHHDAWPRIAGVEIAACCDLDAERARAAAAAVGAPCAHTDYRAMLDRERPDFVDVITPPATHLEICREAAARGIHVSCQKPLAPTSDEARALVDCFEGSRARLMVHENFRFQPWHREIKRLLDAGAIGARLHGLTFRSRPGDGSGDDAYLSRQPYFRGMERFLIHETGIHFIDTFRFLGGEVRRVWCHLRRLNPVIAGEDCGLIFLEFESGAAGVWDANRWNESDCAEGIDPRYTFGEFLVEGDGGAIRMDMGGALTVKPLGRPSRAHEYPRSRAGFGGDCVHATLSHFVERLLDGRPFETGGREYLRNLRIEEALYESARTGRVIDVAGGR
jgi:predicted dehydrogenase